jgi:CheY-like chemotaxis protein
VSVVGSLEDLSFPDILQVVHLSRQSGTLILSDASGERRIRFRNGRVQDASLGAGKPALDALLIERGLVAPAALEPARARSARSGETLAASLVALGALSQETLERLVRDELRALLRSFVLLQEGEFRFEPDDDPSSPEEPAPLHDGLEPESILGDMPQATAPPRWPAEPAAATPVPRRVLLVSERSFLTLALREELERNAFTVELCDGATGAARQAKALEARGLAFLLVCDLLLPDRTRTGWGGGLELLRELRAELPSLIALVIGEMRHASAVAAARAAGATGYLALPDLAAVPFGEVGVRVRDFCTQIGSALALSDQLAGLDWSAQEGTIRVADPLQLLRGLIGELEDSPPGDVGLLVLRLAAEYFERGALFLVRDGRAVCRGAFGARFDERMRGAVIALEEGSLLKNAVEGHETRLGTIPEDASNAALRARLGEPAPPSAALLPMHGGRDVYGLLYGDNALSRRPFEDLRALEIFLAQAGLTLQNALLRRRLESLTGPHPPVQAGRAA